MREKETVLKDMISNGYYLEEKDIERFCKMFTLEQLQDFQRKFMAFKKK